MSRVPYDGRLIRLVNYRIMPRKARLECAGDELVLRLPSFFGRQRWRVPMAEVNVVDLISPQTTIEGFRHSYAGGYFTGLVFAEAVRIPYLFTTGPRMTPTTMLLFATPQRVPPLRGLNAIARDVSLGYFESRTAAGARVDGVLLRAADPADAAAQLLTAGARQVNDPSRWLREHREVVTDPVRAARIASSRKRARTFRSAAMLLLAIFVGSGKWTEHQLPATLWWLLFATVCVVAHVLRLMGRRAARSTVPPDGPIPGEHPNVRAADR